MTTTVTTQAPGWYPDPAGGPSQRWWDGSQWTNLAPTPTPPKRKRIWLRVLVVVVVLFGLMVGGCTALLGSAAKSVSDDADKVAAGGVSTGVGSKDASADVGTPTLLAPDAIGVSYVEVPITNNSSGRSNYWVDLTIETADGATQLDTTSIIVNGLEAGQSTTGKGLVMSEDLTNAKVRITKVQRTAVQLKLAARRCPPFGAGIRHFRGPTRALPATTLPHRTPAA